jgi:hypothetical protein
MPVRYCQIAIFQGFGVAFPGPESGPENSRVGGGENGVSGASFGGDKLCPETIF